MLEHTRRPLLRIATGALASVAVACSVAFPAGPVDDGVCPEDEKACEHACVSRSDPAHGCASASCVSCGIPNAQARCGASGACEFAACVGSFDDCDHDPMNGCEVDVAFDPASCGACGRACVTPNATAGCASGVCVVEECAPGFADCNGRPSDGCEVATDAGCPAMDAGG